LQIARITFAVELLAAVGLSVAFIRRGMAPSEGIFQGVFHAIMSFCNAGLVNLENGSFIPFAGNWLELLPAFFEVTSAFGTVGLSLDVTPNLD
jgi:Trk-type K+ transport system membrane component